MMPPFGFAGVLLLLIVICAAVWALDRYVLRARRAKDTAPPWWIEYPVSFLPVILVVFVLRSFLVEPFKIPSGSMIPTLLIGDYILVNKFTYGIRLPVINTKIVPLGNPERGDVMVFRYPENPSIDYIKRVIGTPGDTIEYRNKRLTINGKLVDVETEADYSYLEHGLNFITTKRYREKFEEAAHSTIVNLDSPPVQLAAVHAFPYRENCEYNDDGFVCKVPAGHYFMMGDNRDASSDSRYWGFVPDENIVGKAFLIWMNFGQLGRIGTAID